MTHEEFEKHKAAEIAKLKAWEEARQLKLTDAYFVTVGNYSGEANPYRER